MFEQKFLFQKSPICKIIKGSGSNESEMIKYNVFLLEFSIFILADLV